MAKQAQTDLVVMENGELQIAEQDDLIVKLKLPTYKDVTDEKVIQYVRDVFHGFTFDRMADFGKQFVDPEQLVAYIKDSIGEIADRQKVGETVKLTNASASLARFWVLGYIIDRTIAQSSYGNGACKQIADAINRSVPYIYQLRAVGTRLTIQDAFLLGMREGCNTTTLRKLAQIRDQDCCRQIIQAFIDATQDTSDVINTERATKAFKQAIQQALKPQNELEEATTNPDDVVEDTTELVSEEYGKADTAIAKILKETRYLSVEENIIQLCDAFDDFYIMGNVPNAAERLSELKARAEDAKAKAQVTIEYLGDVVDAIDRMLHVEVLDEGAKRKRNK